MNKTTIGMAIKALREEKGLSLAELTRQTGLTKSTLYGIENYGRSPHFATVCIIVDTLGVGLDSFRDYCLKYNKENNISPDK
jgi:transcriptional regulator with XRE-family HTH domain